MDHDIQPYGPEYPPAMSAAVAVDLAQQLYKSGDTVGAEKMCHGVLQTAAGALRLLALISRDRGDMPATVSFLERVIELEPATAEHYHLLGTVYHRHGRIDDAADCYQRAIGLNPNATATHNNLGICFADQGRLTEAISSYELAIALDPFFAAGHFNLGNAWQAQRRLDEAIACYENALHIDPAYGKAHANLGLALFAQGHLRRAADQLAKASALLPDCAEVHNNFGAILHEYGDTIRAIELYRQAISLRPGYVEAITNLCDALVEQEAFGEAAETYKMLLQFLPNNAEVYNNLGVALQRGGRVDEAIHSYEQALRINPNYPAALSNLGAAHWEVSNLSSAERAFRQAIRLQPALAEAHAGLAKVLGDATRYNEEMGCFDRAVELAPHDAEIRFARSRAMLRQGDFVRGWQEYEWRWKTKQFQVRDVSWTPSWTPWNGDPLLGRTVLVYAEQGLGDAIQFVRYLPLVKAAGAGVVILAAHARLQQILRGVAGMDVFCPLGTPMPAFDFGVPLLNLPRIFKTTLDTIPAQIPYLTADAQLVADARSRLQQLPGLKVGVCWQGNAENRRDAARSIPIEFIHQLASVDGITLVSLQHRPKPPSCDDGQVVEVFKEKFLDHATGPFMETAAIIMNLDLIVSCDTAVAHLAGALGMPVLLALPYSADWRWLCDRDDAPWYPTMRLFRQTSPGNWRDVFSKIGDSLRKRRDHPA